MNLLLQHLLDSAAVAELIWDLYLAPAVRDSIDQCCDGAGRALYSLVCGVHDAGKATPAFQAKDPTLAQNVREAGLTWKCLGLPDKNWHHTLAGARILKDVLGSAGWDTEALSWIVPLVTGHHGMVPATDRYLRQPRHGHGQGAAWSATQRDLVLAVTGALGIDLRRVRPTSTPPRAVQLAFSGAVIMADWIASGDHFIGVERLDEVSITAARDRATVAWQRLGLRGGWRDRSCLSPPDAFRIRFEQPARPVQVVTLRTAEAMPGPGLIIVEAPMGEGKTEAALAAAELLARRFGADGVFVGMPTQATSDAMFSRVLDWAQSIDPDTPIGLLHGKRRFNRDWQELRRHLRFHEIDDRDDYGCADAYGTQSPGLDDHQPVMAPCEWFLGPKRGLLTPITIGTIDQLLHAATRTRHVMLRHLGLAGRVVILDEVHAYDVYMMQFLTEALRWLGDGRVPVVLLSATLPPATRAELSQAYLQGVLRLRHVDLPAEPESGDAYPVVRSVTVDRRRPTTRHDAAAPWRTSVRVAVEVLDEEPTEQPDRLVHVVQEALTDGGCALVIRNTVGRAQQTYRALREAYRADGTPVVLLHARLTTGERVDRTGRLLDLLGPPGRDGAPVRPSRLVVVATQVAEQSFDVDVDLLVTDVAPIDLLLQRVGRLHRHKRGLDARRPRVRAPRVVAGGVTFSPGQAPAFPAGSEGVYHRYPLLRAAALVWEASTGSGWDVPAQVPELVRRGYSTEPIEPQEWLEESRRARADWAAQQELRRGNADRFVLAGPDKLNMRDLAGLHALPTRDLDDDDQVAAVVRDGPPTVEVVLVHRRGERRFTLDERPLGVNDTAISDPDTAEAVLQSTVRLPPRLTAAALRDLHPLRESGGDPWLSQLRVLDLDDNDSAVLAGRRITYDRELGLLDEPAS
jgi:CRISPR-associated endonuclease/helicase Cas3